MTQTRFLWVSRYAVTRGEDPYVAKCLVDGRTAREVSTFATHVVGLHAFESEQDARFAAEQERSQRLANLRAEVARLAALHFIDTSG